jgi:hypothetical protein
MKNAFVGEMQMGELSLSDIKNDGLPALKRLLKRARGNSGQQTRVADFLLSYWNADTMGGWNVRDIGHLDSDIAYDIISVITMIESGNRDPADLGFEEEFLEIIRRHRCVCR